MMNPPSLNIHETCTEVGVAQAAIRLDRMQTEFRRGRPVLMESADAAAPVMMLATLRERVTSKGGTTHAAITSLDEAGVKAAFVKALQAARARAAALGAATPAL